MAFLFGAMLAFEMVHEEEARKRVRRILRDSQNPFTVSDCEFIKTFRLNKEACLYVIGKVSRVLKQPRHSNKIPVHLRVLCALNFLAVGGHQRSIGNNLWACLSQTVVSRSVSEFVVALIQTCLTESIQFPQNNKQKRDLKSRFFQVHRIHNIIGFVDSTQVAIIKPQMPTSERPYLNKKDYHSINVQIICDADGLILNVVARWPANTPDSFIWNNSRVGRIMSSNYESDEETSAIMGDSGYPCLPWLYVPISSPATTNEQAYNNAIAKAKSSVERCIGVLKGRFRCLLRERTLHYKPHKACRIIAACAILHNFAKKYCVADPEPQVDEIDLDQPISPSPEPDDEYHRRGQEVRQNYIEQYF